jgi:hypothetical protein
MTRIEARGVRCLECAGLDLKSKPEHAKTGFGQCTLADPVHFVSVLMARNCILFEPAPADMVEARDTWAANIQPFWKR